MFSKTFESMYSGSMVGAGLHVFAVWNYILAATHHGYLEINPKLLAFTLGGTEGEIESALLFLQQPDVESRTKSEDGRRIVKEGQFQYRVVNWDVYQGLRSAAERRAYNAEKQAEHRAKTAAELDGLTEEQKVEYLKNKAEAYARRRKPGKRALKHAAQVVGAKAAIADGLDGENGPI